jgi:hypothetical protein
VSGALISRAGLADDLVAHLRATMFADEAAAPEEEAEAEAGAREIARAVLDYFAGAAAGAPPGGFRVLSWVLARVLWVGADAELVDRFFDEVDIDPRRAFEAWAAMGGPARGKFTQVLVPGAKLGEAEIFELTRTLYAQQQG